MGIGPCLCGDTACPSCGPAQGIYPMDARTEEIWAILEEAGCSEKTIDAVCKIVDELAAEANAECPQCEKRYFEELKADEKLAVEYVSGKPAANPPSEVEQLDE